MIGADDPDAVLEQLPEIASKYAPLPMNRTADTGQVFQDIIAEMEGKKPSGVFRFGITVLDNLIGGLPAGALVTVGGSARPTARASSLDNLLSGAYDRDRKVALFFSLEMGKARLSSTGLRCSRGSRSRVVTAVSFSAGYHAWSDWQMTNSYTSLRVREQSNRLQPRPSPTRPAAKSR